MDPKDNLHVVLVNTRNPLNIGAVARAMANFGYTKLRLVGPYEVAFREARSAVGAAELLQSAEVYDSIAEAVADCHVVIGTTSGTNRQPRQEMHTLPDAGTRIAQSAHPSKVALLFGSEKRGLANADMSYCHWLLQIPTAPTYPSMNLAQAVIVVLYELARLQRPDASSESAIPPESPRAEMQTLLRLTETLLQASKISGYTQDTDHSLFEEKLRGLVLRMHLSQADAETWTALFRQLLWKISQV